MTFTQKFPELSGLIDVGNFVFNAEGTLPNYIGWKEMVEKYCLSRSRVREAIEKVFDNIPSSPEVRKGRLLKELGLDEGNQ